jgi:GNAT superfamily N-acetyltransferase
VETGLPIRAMRLCEAVTVIALVKQVFDLFVAPGYSPAGVDEFYRYAEPVAFSARQDADHFTLISIEGQAIVGMIEIRGYDHISMLFVDPAFQRRGVATSMWNRAREICLTHNPELKTITVNSSPFAVQVYASWGFHAISGEVKKNGIRFIPMTFALARACSHLGT